jgi:hypothetical protein
MHNKNTQSDVNEFLSAAFSQYNTLSEVDCVWNVMAHAQKPDFVFRRNGWVHLNRRGASVQSITGNRAVRISLQGLYCSCRPVFCSHVTLTGYPLHSIVSPSPLPCVTLCYHISGGLWQSVVQLQALPKLLLRYLGHWSKYIIHIPAGLICSFSYSVPMRLCGYEQ